MRDWEEFYAEQESLQQEGLFGNLFGISYPPAVKQILAQNPTFKSFYDKQYKTYIGNKFNDAQAHAEATKDLQRELATSQQSRPADAVRGTLGQSWGGGGAFVDRN